MKIEYRYGDILETNAYYICHCVNAQGKMNAGVAKQIRARYPKAYQVYRQRFDALHGKLNLGAIIGADCGQHVILNLVGQEFYGRDGRLYLDYRALRKGIATINNNITVPVAFPMIGAGHAGGDWKIISEIIETESTNFQPIVYSFDDEVPF